MFYVDELVDALGDCGEELGEGVDGDGGRGAASDGYGVCFLRVLAW